jgi:hypothetical protein
MIRESDSSSSGEEGNNQATAGTSEKNIGEITGILQQSNRNRSSTQNVISIEHVYLYFFDKSILLTNFSHFRWKIKGKVERISRLFPIKNYNKIFVFGLRDQSGMIRIKAFGKQAQKYFNVIEKGQFYTLQYTRVDEAISTDQIFPLIHEIVIVETRKNAGYLKKIKQTLQKGPTKSN